MGAMGGGERCSSRRAGGEAGDHLSSVAEDGWNGGMPAGRDLSVGCSTQLVAARLLFLKIRRIQFDQR